MNTARSASAGAGTQTAGLVFGGYDGLVQVRQLQQKNMMVIVGQQVLEV
jgi:hypothetical protein